MNGEHEEDFDETSEINADRPSEFAGFVNPSDRGAFDAEWWFEREETLGRRLKAVVTTYRVGDLSVSTRVEFE